MPSTLWSRPRAGAPWARVELLIGPPAADTLWAATVSLWRLQAWSPHTALPGASVRPLAVSDPSLCLSPQWPPGLTRTSASGSCLAPPATSFWPLLSCPSQHPPRPGGILRQEPTEEALGCPPPSHPRVQWVGCCRQGKERVPGTLPLGKVWSGSGRQSHRGGVCGLQRRRNAWVNSRGGHWTPWGLTLAWRREAHGLGEGGQHRLLCQPQAQPSTQGSGRERVRAVGLRTPVQSCPPHLPLLQAPPPPPFADLLLRHQNQLQSQRGPKHHSPT